MFYEKRVPIREPIVFSIHMLTCVMRTAVFLNFEVLVEFDGLTRVLLGYNIVVR
jgi:hypothetical protein